MDRSITDHPGHIWGYWEACANEYFWFSTIVDKKYLHFWFYIPPVCALWPGSYLGWWNEVFLIIWVTFRDTGKPVQSNISDFLLFWTWNIYIFGPTPPRPVPYDPVTVQGHRPMYYWPSESHLGIPASLCKVILLIFHCFGHEIYKFLVLHPPGLCPMTLWSFRVIDRRSTDHPGHI